MPPNDDLTLDDLRGQSAEQLRAIIARLEADMSDLHTDDSGELRDLSDAEQDRFDRLSNLRGRAEARLRQHEAGMAAYRRNPGAAQAPYANLGPSGDSVLRRAAADVMRMAGDQARDEALRALEMMEAQRGSVPAAQGDRVDRLLRSGDDPGLDASALARRLLVSESPAYRSAFAQLMTQAHPVLTAEEAGAVRAMQRLEAEESRAMGEASGPIGAYGLPVFVDPSIMVSSGASIAPVMDICSVRDVNTNIWKGVSTAPPAFVWATEGTAVSDGSPTLAPPTVNVWMARAFVPYSIEVGMDYPGFYSEISQLLSAGYLDSVASITANGTGTGQPWGVVARLDNLGTSTVRVTTAGTIGAIDVFKVWNNLGERFRARASWLMSVSAESQIRSFSSANQSSSYFTVNLNADGMSVLNGRPLYKSDYAGAFTAVTTHQNFAVVGDFANYVLARRLGLSVEPIPQLFQQVTAGTGPAVPTGQRGMLAYCRFGGDVAVSQGLRLLNQT